MRQRKKPVSNGETGTGSEATQAGLDEGVRSIWRAICVLLVLGLAGLVGAISNRHEVLQNRENGFRSRMVSCLSVVVDSDRTFDIPPQCLVPAVVVFYPPNVCPQLGLNDDQCGTRSDEA